MCKLKAKIKKGKVVIEVPTKLIFTVISIINTLSIFFPFR